MRQRLDGVTATLAPRQAPQSQLCGCTYLVRRFWTVASATFSFELIFVLFLFAGRFKADPRLLWVPVDITALFFGLSVVVGFWILLRRGFRVSRKSFFLALLAVLFVTWVLVSLLWTPGHIYARQKSLFIATLTLWPFLACALIIAPDKRRLRRFFIVLALFTIWLVLETTQQIPSAGTVFRRMWPA